MDWKNLLSFKEIVRLFQNTPRIHVPSINRRQFSRIPLSLEADILSGDIPILSGRTKDLSMKGLFLLSQEQLPIGTDCHLVLLSSGRGPSASLTSLTLGIQVNGTVVRITDSGLGIEFKEIIGQESFDYLHRLLLHRSEKTPAAEQVKEELQRASWSQSTRIIRSLEQGSPLLATRFALKRQRKQADTEIELSPGCVVLLSGPFALHGTATKSRG